MSRFPTVFRFKLPHLTVSAALLFGLLSLWPQSALAEGPASPTHIPTRLVIPAIGLDEPIVPVGWKPVVIGGMTYGQWLADENHVGWHNLSAPLGQPGNTVLNGHSDIYTRVFENLEQVSIGDELVSFSSGQAHRYVITQKILVREQGVSLEARIENASLIMPTEDERLTLITCAYPGATHRLIVIARPLLSAQLKPPALPPPQPPD